MTLQNWKRNVFAQTWGMNSCTFHRTESNLALEELQTVVDEVDAIFIISKSLNEIY